MTPRLTQTVSEALQTGWPAAASFTVAIRTGRRDRSGILWRDDVVVTSDRSSPKEPNFSVVRDGAWEAARLAGRDPGTNVACCRRLCSGPRRRHSHASPPVRGSSPCPGRGADLTGAPTGRLGWCTRPARPGTAWPAGIDTLLRLDARLGSDEGGPVLTLGGRLIGMSTSGPRRRAPAIPAVLVERVLDRLLTDGRIVRRLAGVGLQHVLVPERMREAAGRHRGRHDGGQNWLRRAGRTAGVLPGVSFSTVAAGTPACTRPGRHAGAGPHR